MLELILLIILSSLIIYKKLKRTSIYDLFLQNYINDIFLNKLCIFLNYNYILILDKNYNPIFKSHIEYTNYYNLKYIKYLYYINNDLIYPIYFNNKLCTYIIISNFRRNKFNYFILYKMVYYITKKIKYKEVKSKLDDALVYLYYTFDAIGDYLIIFDNDGIIKNINKSFLELIKINNKDDIINTFMLDFLKKYFNYNFLNFNTHPLFNCLKNKTHTSYESYIEKYDIYISATISPIINNNNQIIGYIYLIKDITEIKYNNILLEQKVKERITNLNKFLYTVCHDLKSPIRHILTYIELLKEHSDILEQYYEYLEVLELSSNILNTMTTNIINICKLSTINYKISYVDINEIITYILCTRPNNLYFNIQPNLVIKSNRELIFNLFDNLITNAIKYNNKSHKLIEIGYFDNTYFVSDNGNGIDNNLFDKIFEPFKQFDQIENGHGIGLTSVKKIVEMHNGKIWVESEIDYGTCFYFQLGELIND